MPRLTQLAGIQKTPTAQDTFVLPTISLNSGPGPGVNFSEGDNVTFTVEVFDGNPQVGDTISYTLGGTPNASDYSIPLTGTMTIYLQNGKYLADLTFDILEDLTTESGSFEGGNVTFEYTYTNPLTGVSGTTQFGQTFNIIDTSQTPANPTYVLNRTTSSANEGESFTISLVTANVAGGTTVPYTITGVSSADIGGASLTGNFVIGTTDDVTFNVTADATTEGVETFSLELDNGEDTITVTINDTSLDPTYAVSASRASVNEGESFTINLTTTDVQDGVGVGYTITGVSSADIDGASLTGSFTVSNNAASLNVTVTADQSLGEGNETFTLSLNNGADAVSVDIADSSIDTTPTYSSLTLQSASSVNEGAASTFRITGRNIAQNTTIDVTLTGVTGTVAANDFAPASLTRTVTWTGASNPITQSQDFTVTLAEDEITEGAESFKCVLSATDSNGTATGGLESPTVTIGDISLSPVIGQAEWFGLTTSDLGTSWTVPTDVTSISIVCIGGGGGGAGCANSYGYAGGGGGGGGLAYANNVSVTPGETLTIKAGRAGAAGSRGQNGTDGGISSVRRGSTDLCSVNGGYGGSASNVGGDGGGANGTGTRYTGGAGGPGQSYSRGGGGGGAAGYSGDGGDARGGNNFSAGENGSGGGGGGGGACSTSPGQTGGGGIQNKGQGSNGVGGSYNQDGGGGSGGEVGQNGIGGALGGGGSGTSYTGNPSQGNGQRGGVGSVRIIYPGTSRQFPSTRTANEAAVSGTYDSIIRNDAEIQEYPSTLNDATVTFTLSTSDVPQGTTVGYSFVNVQGTVTADDFINRDTLFTIGSDGTATVSMQATGDWVTEGTEIFKIQLASTDSIGNDTEDLQSPNVTITDNYPATIYNSISLDKSNYNEGEQVTISVDYTNNTDKAISVAYTVSSSSGSSTDFDNTYGILNLIGGNTYEGPPYAGTKTTITADLTTEGAETMTVTLNSTDSNGNPTNNRSATATINDTSLTPRVPGQSLDGYIQMPAYDDQVGGARPGAGWGAVLGGDDDFVVVGSYLSARPSSAGSYEAAHGQVHIYNRQTKALLHVIENPLTGSAYVSERTIMFGSGVGLSKVGSTYYLAVAGSNFKYNGVSYYDPRIFIYKSTNNWTTYSLHKTARLGTSDTGNPNTQSDIRFRVGGDYLVYGYNNMSNSGTVRWMQLSSNGTSDLSTPVAQWESLASTTIQQYQNFEAGSSVDIDGTYILYGSYERDYTQGANSYQNTGTAQLAFVANGAGYSYQGGQTYAGSSTNYSNFEFGKGVAIAGNYYAVASGGDDYSGNTDAGRVRCFQMSTGGLRATINRPVFSPGISGGGGSKFYGGQLVGNSDGYIAVLWQDVYGQDNNTLRIYNAANGSLVNTVPHPGNVTYIPNVNVDLYHYNRIHLTKSYVFTRTTALNTQGGSARCRIYIH